MFKKLILSLSFLILNGCGFQPIYAPITSSPQVFRLSITGNNDIAYTTYKLKKEIETLLPTVCQKVNYPLTVKIQLSQTFGNIAVNSNTNVLRGQGQLKATVEIFDRDRASPYYTRTLDEQSSYTVNYLDEFTNITTEQGTKERLIKTLAQDIVRELALAPAPCA